MGARCSSSSAMVRPRTHDLATLTIRNADKLCVTAVVQRRRGGHSVVDWDRAVIPPLLHGYADVTVTVALILLPFILGFDNSTAIQSSAGAATARPRVELRRLTATRGSRGTRGREDAAVSIEISYTPETWAKLIGSAALR